MDIEEDALFDEDVRPRDLMKPVVILADDDEDFCALMGMVLQGELVEVLSATSVEKGKVAIHEASARVSVCFFDINFEGDNPLEGIELIEYARKISHKRTLIYALSADRREEVHQMAMDAGANGFLYKPISPETIVRYVRSSFPSLESVTELLRDRLTGLFSYGAFVAMVLDDLEKLVSDRRDEDRGDRREEDPTIHASFSVIFMDGYRFKLINDTCGHAVGDRVIELYAKVIKENTRSGYHLCRRSGDEFLVWLPGASHEEALSRVRELERAMSEVALPEEMIEKGWGEISASFGVHTMTIFDINRENIEETLETLLEEADKDMLRNKKLKRGERG